MEPKMNILCLAKDGYLLTKVKVEKILRSDKEYQNEVTTDTIHN